MYVCTALFNLRNQFLSYLHGVEGGAFPQVVCNYPHIEAVLHGVVFPDPAYVSSVLIGYVNRKRVYILFRHVIDDNAVSV